MRLVLFLSERESSRHASHENLALSVVKFHHLFRSDNFTAERSFILCHSVGNILSLPFNQASNQEASMKSVCNLKY